MLGLSQSVEVLSSTMNISFSVEVIACVASRRVASRRAASKRRPYFKQQRRLAASQFNGDSAPKVTHASGSSCNLWGEFACLGGADFWRILHSCTPSVPAACAPVSTRWRRLACPPRPWTRPRGWSPSMCHDHRQHCRYHQHVHHQHSSLHHLWIAHPLRRAPSLHHDRFEHEPLTSFIRHV